MGELPKRDEIAPSLNDLSHAHVHNSHLFGLTNLSGKALTAVAIGSIAVGTTVLSKAGFNAGDLLQGFYNTWPAVTGALGVAFASGAAGWWVGDYDDRTIGNHNDRQGYLSHAHRKQEDKLQDIFVKVVSKADYDPAKKTLPHDALGAAVYFPDEKIAKMPPHVQFDIYRTQMDLALFYKTGHHSHQIYEAMAYEARVLAKDIGMQEKADLFRENRNSIINLIDEGVLEYTPIPADAPKKSWGERLSDFMGEVGDALAVSKSDGGSIHIGNGWGRSRGGSGGGSIISGGGSSTPAPGSIGGSFGGEGFRTGGAIPSTGAFVTGGGFASDASGAYASFGNSGSGSRSSGGSSRKSGGGGGGGNVDLSGAGQGLVIIAGIAAASAAFIATGFSIHKNFLSRAEDPEIEGVSMPYLMNALPSAQKAVRQMYAPG